MIFDVVRETSSHLQVIFIFIILLVWYIVVKDFYFKIIPDNSTLTSR